MEIPNTLIDSVANHVGRELWSAHPSVHEIEVIRIAAPLIAKWARDAALKEAATVVRQIPCWADGKGHSGFDVGPDPVRVVTEAIQALAAGEGCDLVAERARKEAAGLRQRVSTLEAALKEIGDWNDGADLDDYSPWLTDFIDDALADPIEQPLSLDNR
jgi:hypothetical protein